MRKRLLTSFIAICSILGGINLQATNYNLVTSADQLEVGAEYLVAYTQGIQTYAMGGVSSTKKYRLREAVTMTDGTLTINNEAVSPVTLEASGNADFPFQLVVSEGYLYNNTTSNELTTTTTKATEKSYCTISISAEGVATITYNAKKSNKAYQLQYNKAANQERFSAYTGTQENPSLYKKEVGDPSKTDVTLQWGAGDTSITELNVEAGETFTAPTLKATPEEALDAVIYSSSDESVATIADGTLTLVNFGTAEITAEIKDNDTYNNASATYTLKYSKKDPKLYFEREVRYGKLGVGVVWEAAKHIGDGTLTYTSSNPEIVAVNETTGQILPEDVNATGTVVITATLEATDTYASATADYSIVIQDPSSTDDAGGQFMFDFQEKDPYGMTTRTDNAYDTAERTITPTDANVSLVLKGNHRSYGTTSFDLRIAQSASFTVLVPSTSSAIEKITRKTTDKFSASTGTISTGTAEEQGMKVWTSSADTDINEVTFTKETSGAAKVKTITVIWRNLNSGLEIADLSFDQTVYNTTVGVETEVNPVNNPNNVAATYSIDCLNDDEYTLTEADGKLAITVNKVGVYTLRAKSEATDAYLPGIAILRLNVFPVVGINVNEAPVTPTEENMISLTGGDKVSFGELPVTVRLFHLMEVANETLPTTLTAASITHDDIDEEYTGTPIEFTQPGYLHYYMSYAGAYNSPIQTLTVNVDGKTPTGIENVAADNANAPIEYFNLQGIRIDNPGAGLYIRRQGNATAKVIVK